MKSPFGFLVHSERNQAGIQLIKCLMCISSYLARLSTTNRKEKASFDEQFVLY